MDDGQNVVDTRHTFRDDEVLSCISLLELCIDTQLLGQA